MQHPSEGPSMVEWLAPAGWAHLAQTLEGVGRRAVFEAPRTRSPLIAAEGLRFGTRLFAEGSLLEIENVDPAYPQLTRFATPWLQFGIPNPDVGYRLAPLHGDFEYRIFGSKGTARVLHMEVWSGEFGRLHEMSVFSSGTDFEVSEDGTIEIVVSREKRPGNWLSLPGGRATLLVREYFYDWDSEVPSSLDIERTGAVYPPPPPQPLDIAKRLEDLDRWLTNIPFIFGVGVEGYYSAPDDRLLFPEASPGSHISEHSVGAQDQRYGQGHYSCGPDEAIVLEVSPPAAVYWGFHLLTDYWESLDFNVRQTSLNGHQAVLDHDGLFRAVISQQDPGVPNWLDTAGHDSGLLTGRYLRADGAPEPTLRRVRFDELLDVLPPDTPRVSPQERSAVLRRRFLAVRRQNRSD